MTAALRFVFEILKAALLFAMLIEAIRIGWVGAFYLGLAVLTGVIAWFYGRSFTTWTVLSAIFTPLAGAIALLILPRRSPERPST